MTAVFNRCDVGRMVAAAAAIQRQCERVRRRCRYVAVRKSGVIVVVSFAVSAVFALRPRRLFSPSSLFHLSSFPPRIRRLSSFISSSFAGIALRHRRRAYLSSFLIRRRCRNLFVVAVTFRHVLLLLCRHVLYCCRVFHSLSLTCGFVVLSVCHGLILFFPCRSVCLSAKRLLQRHFSFIYCSSVGFL
jgi:hypothetical protein